jgi:serine/threonine-protein kinase
MADNIQEIGPYSVEAEIGRGGMGVVYRAIDTRLGRAVAIKALEARTLAALNHPNVAGIHGVEEHQGRRYLVLEYVDGETLAERLDRGTLAVDEALEVCGQIAAGVEAAHEAGIIHRDLKPGNVKLTPDGKVKVLDFGLAKEAEEGSSSSVDLTRSPTLTAAQSPTAAGVILGTAPYMSPEQARGRPVDRRSDIWSFGVVLYECLTGASPYVGETVSDSIAAILQADVDLDRLPVGTPRLVRRVLRRCLARDKDRRYRDIGDVRLELFEAREGDGEEDLLAEATGGRRAILAWVVAAVALVALVATVAWIGLQPREMPMRLVTDIGVIARRYADCHRRRARERDVAHRARPDHGRGTHGCFG